MRGPTHQRWTPEDRKRLAELASQYGSDYTIAKMMGRKAPAVSWQRRSLRIRLGGKSESKGRRTAAYSVESATSREPMDRVEKMMQIVNRLMRG